jgi:hypothetical protein
MVGASSTRQDKGEQDHSYDRDDLEAREPEFELAKEANAEVVDTDDNNQEDGNEDARIDLFPREPKLDD